MEITNPQYFVEQMKYAHEIGDKSLLECLGRLAYYESGKCEDHPDGWPYDDSRCCSQVHIHKDFDDHSFVWSWVDRNGKLIMNGGLIFHGTPGSPDTSHSVTLDRTYGWSIHT